MKIKAVIFDLDGTITKPYLDFDKIRQEMGLAADAGPLLEIMEKMNRLSCVLTGDYIGVIILP